MKHLSQILLAQILLGTVTILGSAAGAQSQGNTPAGGATAETESPNTSYTPMVQGQTRAPKPATATKVATATAAQGLASGWAFEILPDGRMIVTEKAGTLRLVAKDGALGKPIAGIPKVDSRGQGGLLDVALSPGFAADRTIYLSYAEPREKGNGTSVARAKLVEEGGSARLDDLKVIFRQTPSYEGDKHYGSRLVFSPDGKLFVTVGERSDKTPRVQAQDLSSGLGKVFRIEPDGGVPKDNPFAGSDKAKPEIWSYGHRNVQGIALDAEGRVWVAEHGPRGGDELNRPRAGLNYGWPEASYGIEYDGGKIGAGKTQAPGTVQPVYYWDPVIGPSSLTLYQGTLFPAWSNGFLIGGLVSNGLVVVKLDGDTVVSEERVPLEARIRDVKVGPDGAVYALTDGPDGKILKLTPGSGS